MIRRVIRLLVALAVLLSPTALPAQMRFSQSSPSTGIILCQSAAAVSMTGDTAEHTLATCTAPANAIGPNGRIALEYDMSLTGSGTKTLRFKFGATTLFSLSRTTQADDAGIITIANRNSAASQRAVLRLFTNTATGKQVTTSTLDTTANVDITITGQLVTTSDSVTLEGYQTLEYPKG